MKSGFKQKFNNFLERDWVQKGEGRLTYVQVFGFGLISLSVLYFASFLMPTGVNQLLPSSFQLAEEPSAYGISIAFFTTMLGVAFAFPEMLQVPTKTKEVSTMRIIVFMFANLICMLLLKIGWDKESLTSIGLDGYWMGVIAFLFGAKATQSYFENADKLRSLSQGKTSDNSTTDGKNIGISQIAIAQIAKVQNEGKLYSRCTNIQSVSDTLKDGKSCLTIYISDNNLKDIPSSVPAELNESLTLMVPTEIIPNTDPATPHIGQATDELSDSDNPGGFGSICCIVSSTDNPNSNFVVTAGHNFTKGKYKSMKGFVFGNDQRNVLINGVVKGKLYYQRMHFTQDLAIVRLTNNRNLKKDYISFEAGFHQLDAHDIKTAAPNITIASRVNSDRLGSNVRDAFILDHNIPFDIMYDGEKKRMQNVILIGNSNDPLTSKEISLRGDSGSCVFHKDSKKLI
jgi:hypothetical protein